MAALFSMIPSFDGVCFSVVIGLELLRCAIRIYIGLVATCSVSDLYSSFTLCLDSLLYDHGDYQLFFTNGLRQPVQTATWVEMIARCSLKGS